MSENTVCGGDYDVSKLSRRKDIVSPLFEFGNGNIVSWRDNTTFINTPNEFDYNFFRSVIVDNFEFTDVPVLLHDSQELEKDL